MAQIYTKTVGFSTDSKLDLDVAGSGYVKNMGPHTAYLYYKEHIATVNTLQGSESWLMALGVGDGAPFEMFDANGSVSLCARTTVDSNPTTLKYWDV